MTRLQKTGFVYLSVNTLISAVFSILHRTGGETQPLFIQFPAIQYVVLIFAVFAYISFYYLQHRKNPDKLSPGQAYKEYTREKYPELYKKLYPLGLMSYNAHFIGFMRDREDEGEDEILKNMKAYHKTNILLMVWGFMITLVFSIINSL